MLRRHRLNALLIPQSWWTLLMDYLPGALTGACGQAGPRVSNVTKGYNKCWEVFCLPICFKVANRTWARYATCNSTNPARNDLWLWWTSLMNLMTPHQKHKRTKRAQPHHRLQLKLLAWIGWQKKSKNSWKATRRKASQHKPPSKKTKRAKLPRRRLELQAVLGFPAKAKHSQGQERQHPSILRRLPSIHAPTRVRGGWRKPETKKTEPFLGRRRNQKKFGEKSWTTWHHCERATWGSPMGEQRRTCVRWKKWGHTVCGAIWLYIYIWYMFLFVRWSNSYFTTPAQTPVIHLVFLHCFCMVSWKSKMIMLNDKQFAHFPRWCIYNGLNIGYLFWNNAFVWRISLP